MRCQATWGNYGFRAGSGIQEGIALPHPKPRTLQPGGAFFFAWAYGYGRKRQGLGLVVVAGVVVVALAVVCFGPDLLFLMLVSFLLLSIFFLVVVGTLLGLWLLLLLYNLIKVLITLLLIAQRASSRLLSPGDVRGRVELCLKCQRGMIRARLSTGVVSNMSDAMYKP